VLLNIATNFLQPLYYSYLPSYAFYGAAGGVSNKEEARCIMLIIIFVVKLD